MTLSSHECEGIFEATRLPRDLLLQTYNYCFKLDELFFQGQSSAARGNRSSDTLSESQCNNIFWNFTRTGNSLVLTGCRFSDLEGWACLPFSSICLIFFHGFLHHYLCHSLLHGKMFSVLSLKCIPIALFLSFTLSHPFCVETVARAYGTWQLTHSY